MKYYHIILFYAKITLIFFDKSSKKISSLSLAYFSRVHKLRFFTYFSYSDLSIVFIWPKSINISLDWIKFIQIWKSKNEGMISAIFCHLKSILETSYNLRTVLKLLTNFSSNSNWSKLSNFFWSKDMYLNNQISALREGKFALSIFWFIISFHISVLQKISLKKSDR